MLFGTITKISSIQLSRNGFTNFPINDPNFLKRINVSISLVLLQFLIFLSLLQSLSIEHNQITKIPLGIFSQAPELTSLNLRDNQITTLPLGMCMCGCISPYLELCSVRWLIQCVCGVVVDFGSWVSLTELDLGTNQLMALPEDIQELTRLEELVLSNNAIRVSPSSEEMKFISSEEC